MAVVLRDTVKNLLFAVGGGGLTDGVTIAHNDA